MDVEALETALRASPDRDTLEVYADYLQSIGDVRGELIAIDLGLERSPLPALERRRDELLHAWLGTPHMGKVRHGFLELDVNEKDGDAPRLLDHALDGPGGRFVRSITVDGGDFVIAHAADAIGRAQRPWLTRLSLRCTEADYGWSISPLEWSALVAAMPHLEVLELDGGFVVRQLYHPSIRRFVLTGHDAFTAADLPALTELDFGFASTAASYAGSRPAADDDHARVLAVLDAFPALTRLDLSRNEPGFVTPVNLGGLVRVFDVVRALAHKHRLVELRVPSLHDASDVAALHAALEQMPALQDLVLARTKRKMAGRVSHPTARIRCE